MDAVAERAANFYLGQEHDLAQGDTSDVQVHYDARDLTTHAVCLGMTGSGKTGLGVILLEEAALDGVPSLVIDPKGDMTNLLLTFPELRPQDFAPWVNPDDARRKDMDIDSYAAAMANLWRKGLAGTGQVPDRIRRLRESADFGIYTPGSSAGWQLSILDTLKAPDLSWDSDGEIIRDKIESLVSALLGMIGIEADPVQSREHILLANILENAWRAGEDLDLAQLIMRVQKPPFTQLGVFPVDTFFPEKDRMGLAMQINGLMASPAFADWIQGEPLDIDSLLTSRTGKPRVSVLYVAHLSDAERQFFVTLLLQQLVGWMRAQSGTTSLRAMLYMDEVFGFLPPHPANPPTKKPLLTLLKQARAFGLGLVLATQNPVDLDYKALSNAGTWFIGRMQADRDKQRLLDGLEGVAVGTGGASRAEFDRMISALGSRVFLLHNVHESEPVIFHTRWALSYLRGPLTRPQVQDLVGKQPPQQAQRPPAGDVARPQASAPEPHSAAPAEVQPAAGPPEPQPPDGSAAYNRVPPQLPSAVKQVFLAARLSERAALERLARDRNWPARVTKEARSFLVYEPALIGMAKLRFPHTKSRQTDTLEATYLLRPAGEGFVVDWSQGRVDLEARELEYEPESGAYFAELPSDMGAAKQYTALKDEFEDHLYYNSIRILRHNPHIELFSTFDETEAAFQRRCRKAAKEASDAEADKLRTKYERELDRLEDKMEREERELEKDKIEHDARKQEEMLSGVESVLGLFSKRRSTRGLSTASRRRRMTRQARADIKESEETIEDLELEIEELEAEAKGELEELTQKWAELIDDVELVEVRPRRADVRLELFGLAWLPRWEVEAAGQVAAVPAFEAEPIA